MFILFVVSQPLTVREACHQRSLSVLLSVVTVVTMVTVTSVRVRQIPPLPPSL